MMVNVDDVRTVVDINVIIKTVYNSELNRIFFQQKNISEFRLAKQIAVGLLALYHFV